MKILFVGDVFGNAGRLAVTTLLPPLIKELDCDLVIANGENATNGRGIHSKHVRELQNAGVDLITSGNHIFDEKEVIPLLSDPKSPLLRPINYPRRSPGRGFRLTTDRRGVPVLVVNIMGSVFMEPVDLPFQIMDDLLMEYRDQAKIVFVDFHGEASSEKRAFAWYFMGKVSAVIGTHTHVPTADEEILDGKTAYLTDVGMTGPYRSVIGMDIGTILKKFTTKVSERPKPSEEDARLSCVYLDIEDHTGRALEIRRIQRRVMS